jgi:hypothetical protein
MCNYRACRPIPFDDLHYADPIVVTYRHPDGGTDFAIGWFLGIEKLDCAYFLVMQRKDKPGIDLDTKSIIEIVRSKERRTPRALG